MLSTKAHGLLSLEQLSRLSGKSFRTVRKRLEHLEPAKRTKTAILYHATWLVNSATHVWGYRSHDTRDHSTNLWWVALITLGEGWHNNHHAFPRSARHGLRWWELDVTYLFIRLLSFLGLARQIHVPGKILRQIASADRQLEKSGELASS